MADKVIFEMRAKKVNNQYQYRIRHPQEGITVTFDVNGICQPVFHNCARKNMRCLRNHRISDKARRHMRRTLDFYEELYSQLYNENDVANLSRESEEKGNAG